MRRLKIRSPAMVLIGLFSLAPSVVIGQELNVGKPYHDLIRAGSSPTPWQLYSDVAPTYQLSEPYDLLESVTLTDVPPGSERIMYAGPTRLLVKLASSRFRRLWRDSISLQSDYWSVGHETRYMQYMSNLWDATDTNGQWFTRTWQDSLMPHMGGAPLTPFTRVIGSDASLRVGPITVTNTLKLRVDYVASLDFNPDPTPNLDPNRPPLVESTDRVSVDVTPADYDTPVVKWSFISFKVRPHIRIGFPKGNEWHSVLRRISLRVDLEIVYLGRELLHSEVELQLDRENGVTIMAQVSLLVW